MLPALLEFGCGRRRSPGVPWRCPGCVVGFFMLRSCSTAGAGPSSCPDSYDCVHLTHMRVACLLDRRVLR